jgi:hypothetical protein
MAPNGAQNEGDVPFFDKLPITRPEYHWMIQPQSIGH